MDSQKELFIFKTLAKYFLFGYLCLAGLLFLSFLIIFISKNFSFPLRLFSVVPAFVFIPLFAQFVRILISIPEKYKFFKISVYRLKTRGYKDEYFECEMHEPCFRLMIKDLLENFGYGNEYLHLKQKCAQSDVRVEKAKERLLRKVKAQNLEKMSR